MSTSTEEGPLRELILDEVRASDGITFDRFMELALYHPEHGYYSSPTPRIGPEGDYYTSTDVSPLFGATIGRQLHEMWLLLDRPDRFDVVELGAGKGLLAADILGWTGAAHPSFHRAISYAIQELSPGMESYQRAKLSQLPVRWVQPGETPAGSLVGCVLSNEVADALPFHRATLLQGKLWELWVVERGGVLMEAPAELSTSLLADRLAEESVRLAERQTVEICLRAHGWMQAQVELLRSGFVLAIDYGDRARELYDPSRPEGTLACYHRHTLNKQPFERIGQQDITAHVNFTALACAAREAGAAVTGYTSQAYFLAGFGLGDALPRSAQRAANVWEYERDRTAVEALIRPDGLGGFGVLIAHKGLATSPTLSGLSLGSEEI